MKSRTKAVLLAVTATLAVHPLAAQVVRESDVSALAGTLGGAELEAYDDFTFGSGGGEILFASLDAAIYQTQGAGGHEDHEAAAMPEEEPGGCGGEDDGAIGTCLQLLDEADQVLCWATRPRAPGWQRDPRLICLLPHRDGKPATYRLRVALADEDCSDLTYPIPATADDLPYLLAVSLRRVAGPGPLAPAIGTSRNKL